MCHVSPVTCHMSNKVSFYIKKKTSENIGQRGGASRWRVCYQWGLPRLVFKVRKQIGEQNIIYIYLLTKKLYFLSPFIVNHVTQELITEADLDGDGNVNYEEFITMLFKVTYILKNPAYGRQRISRPMRIVAPIPQ